MIGSSLNRTQRIAFVVTAALLGAAVTTAWLIEAGNPEGAYSFTVVDSGREVARFDIDDLNDMEWRSVRMQGQDQEGPTLLSVIERAGIDSFSVVEVHGPGVRDDGFIRLSADEIDRDVLLDIAERGTAKLCGTRVAWEDRVRDIQSIEVR